MRARHGTLPDPRLLDFPNQGRASPAAGALGLIEQAEILHLVFSQVSPADPVDLCGASWGALVAAVCAARYTWAVEKLLLGSFQVRSTPRLQRVAAQSVRLIEREATRELAEHFIEEFGAGLSEAFRDAIRAQFARLRADELVQIFPHLEQESVMNTYLDFAQVAAGVD